MPRLILPGGGTGGITIQGNVHIRFIGVEIAAKGDKGMSYMVFMKGAQYVIFDRVWIHGLPDVECCTAIEAAGANYSALIDSFTSDLHGLGKVCLESQAYHAGTGGYDWGRFPDGPHKVVNNYLESAAQQVFFGGGRANAPSTDIEVRRNFMNKPFIWNPSHPEYNGTAWVVKPIVECKNCDRILFEANIMQNTWGQYNAAFTLTPKNQTNSQGEGMCPDCVVLNVIARWNWISNVGGLTQMLNGGRDGTEGKAGNKYSMHDMLVEGVQYEYCYQCKNYASEMITKFGGVSLLQDVVLNHITLLADPAEYWNGGMLLVGAQGDEPMSNMSWTNSIMHIGKYGVHMEKSCAGLTKWTTDAELLEACWHPGLFRSNLLVGGQGNAPKPSKWPPGNFFADNMAAIGFAEGTYVILPQSPYFRACPDGRDPGVDMPTLQAAVAGVKDGHAVA